MTDLLKLAIDDNAAWCTFVGSDLHGVPGSHRFGGLLFSGQLPDYYPNFVTLDARRAEQQQDGLVDAPIRAGFRPLHAMRVWIRPGAGT